jgi:choline dehydrogenase-like flavoprotein
MAEAFCRKPFDYMIVGGGTSGLALAARLSEDPDVMVGVIEAGTAAFDDPRINIPGRFGESLGTDHDWKFETVPQPGFNGRKIPWPRGKVLGGTSAINFMTWNRAMKENYDAWEELGNKGWSFENLMCVILNFND